MQNYTEEEIYELGQAWVEANPQPIVTNPDDYDQAMAMALWIARSNTEIERLHGTSPLPTVSEWRIRQEIINRQDNTSCLKAALDYIETVFYAAEQE